MIDIEQLKTTYPKYRERYLELGERIKTTLGHLLEKKKIHVITTRAKDIESLIRKIISKDKYEDLVDVTDLCGVRIITNMESDIEYVSKIIRKSFRIDETHSHDHRKRSVNDFGYLSLHIVLSLDSDREGLAENIRIKGLKAEIQIRSILQHAWAEIEHDLGYKDNASIPEELQRGSNRLSAILEAADLEFVRLQELKLKHINQAVNAISSPNITTTPIDILNIKTLDAHSGTLNAVRNMLEEKHQVTFVVRGDYQHILDKLKYFDIRYLEQLEQDLVENRENLIKFSDLLFQRRNDKRKHILYEAPLEYFLHFKGSVDTEHWEEYKYFGSVDCKSSIKEVTDFVQLHMDTVARRP
ncbi:hypothetical protein GFS24_20770 [Chitinophaga sp. SYP-B3965]|uniref:GTP pyrophosphokinase n=1 Tax=Chitinophaga sp. SYP-B3965 TaxID=2663120 RepID=UPI001299EB0A|nr:hypothetical protein [Chitinophaga sp. SYP-B3965]MRG47568.1 hypothetical protein [Chitinophaga sp. SYP-B3965]